MIRPAFSAGRTASSSIRLGAIGLRGGCGAGADEVGGREAMECRPTPVWLQDAK